MAIYAVGDIQGCYRPLRELLDQVAFDPARDRLWCVGDLVNRGPDSLATLRYLSSLGDAAICVLGNHDMLLLQRMAGATRRSQGDTLDQVLAAKDAEECIEWLRFRPLMHYDADLGMAMVHAGLAPGWSLKKALRRAARIEKRLRADSWREHCLAWSRARFPEQDPGKVDRDGRLLFSLGVFTCARFCSPDGVFNWRANRADSDRVGDAPWYLHPRMKWRKDVRRVVFGHWAAMGLVAHYPHVLGLDSGCVWNGKLSLARLDTHPIHIRSLSCRACRG